MKATVTTLLAASVLMSGIAGVAAPAAAKRKQPYGYAPYGYVPVAPAPYANAPAPVPLTACDLGLPISAFIAADFPPFPTAMVLAPMPAAPLALSRVDMVIMDMAPIRIASQDMVRFSAPTLGGARWVALEWMEEFNKVSCRS